MCPNQWGGAPRAAAASGSGTDRTVPDQNEGPLAFAEKREPNWLELDADASGDAGGHGA